MKEKKEMTNWPDHKSGAFFFCFDVDADTIWNNKIAAYSNGENFIRSRSVGLYGILRGVDEILGLLDRYQIKASFFVPAVIVKNYPDKIKKIVGKGHEIAHHGYYHESDYGKTAEEQLKLLADSQEVFQQVLGKAACGFRMTGSLLPETAEIFFQRDDVLYVSQQNGDPDIHFVKAGGKDTRVISIPCKIEIDDYVQSVFNLFPPVPKGLDRIAPYQDILQNFKLMADATEKYHQAIASAFHPQISGCQGRLTVLEALMRYVTQDTNLWTGRCCDLAEWCRQQKEGEQQNEMERR